MRFARSPGSHFEKEFKKKGLPIADGDEPITEVRRATNEDEIRAAARARAKGGLASVVEAPDDMEDDEAPDEPTVGVEEGPSAADPGNKVPPPVATGVPEEVREILHPTDEEDVEMTSAPIPPAAAVPAPDFGGLRCGILSARSSLPCLPFMVGRNH